MPDLKLLESIISDSGMTMVALAEKPAIRGEPLNNKIGGICELNDSEIDQL